MGYDVYHTVYKVKKADDKFEKMKKVAQACIEAEIEPTREVYDYFECDFDLEALACCVTHDGVKVPCAEAEYEHSKTDYDADLYTVDLSKLPKDVTTIVFEVTHSY